MPSSASVAPCARRRRALAFCAGVNFGGQPIRCPRFCARLRPSAVRIRIRSRSTSARPPKTAIIKRPVLVPVSAHGSASERNCASASTICSTIANRSKVLRARRSMLVTVGPGCMRQRPNLAADSTSIAWPLYVKREARAMTVSFTTTATDFGRDRQHPPSAMSRMSMNFVVSSTKHLSRQNAFALSGQIALSR
jgi:hypothetical protein